MAINDVAVLQVAPHELLPEAAMADSHNSVPAAGPQRLAELPRAPLRVVLRPWPPALGEALPALPSGHVRGQLGQRLCLRHTVVAGRGVAFRGQHLDHHSQRSLPAAHEQPCGLHGAPQRRGQEDVGRADGVPRGAAPRGDRLLAPRLREGVVGPLQELLVHIVARLRVPDEGRPARVRGHLRRRAPCPSRKDTRGRSQRGKVALGPFGGGGGVTVAAAQELLVDNCPAGVEYHPVDVLV
mmetsp:Transcript_51203/g.158811  ORF Transcript_51203/g.158811 Transcript_51203/m.158811 type:complete len:240 (-) Transcript_51203:1527-2246(-)